MIEVFKRPPVIEHLSINAWFFARQTACLLLCALFLLPAAIVRPALAVANAPCSEEREESNKNDDSSDDSTNQDSIHQVNRRVVSQRSPIAHSVETTVTYCRHFRSHFSAIELKDVYQNGLGTRLRC